jgi:hypothetical protein
VKVMAMIIEASFYTQLNNGIETVVTILPIIVLHTIWRSWLCWATLQKYQQRVEQVHS